MSWTKDILAILEKLKNLAAKDHKKAIKELIQFLAWLKKMKNAPTRKLTENFKKNLLEITRTCLLEELNRLSKVKGWGVSKHGKAEYITFSPIKSSKVRLAFMHRKSLEIIITAQTNKNKQGNTIVIPLEGAYDQVFNFIDIAALKICKTVFKGCVNYRNNSPRTKQRGLKDHHKKLYEFIENYHKQLKIMFELAPYEMEEN